MFKRITIMLMLVACCYCLESTVMVQEESRAKRKRSPIRLLAMILLFVISKVAIVKVASFFMFMAVFQKIFSAAGLILGYFMRSQGSPMPVPSQPLQPTYGPPQEYNTLGYSYGPPDHEVFQDNLPNVAEFSNKFNSWLKP
ncbi:uncharacterized protein LOC115449001 [Manduca sexta]|uniref:uncharacterized protein LOC115449001 n=1 Tax=Manduca sexta TaxID=7130 RepID=UPI00188F766C|nr:uncharacterized protein LOC115449001 [Manduca sexta]